MDVNSVSAYSVTAAPPVAAAPAQPATAVQPSAQVSEPAGKPAEEVLSQSHIPPENTVKKAGENKDAQKSADDSRSLDVALEQINKMLSNFQRKMEVSVHSKLNRIMVKVVDTAQDKVIREIPPKKVLDAFADALEMAGVLLDVKQ